MLLKPSFYDEFGRAIDKPVNAVAYEITNGGDRVRGRPDTWGILESAVYSVLQTYRDTDHISPKQVREELKVWLDMNEKKVQ